MTDNKYNDDSTTSIGPGHYRRGRGAQLRNDSINPPKEEKAKPAATVYWLSVNGTGGGLTNGGLRV